jgi:hypothetical protein
MLAACVKDRTQRLSVQGWTERKVSSKKQASLSVSTVRTSITTQTRQQVLQNDRSHESVRSIPDKRAANYYDYMTQRAL